MTSRLFLCEHIGLAPVAHVLPVRQRAEFDEGQWARGPHGPLREKAPEGIARSFNRIEQSLSPHALVQEFEPGLLPFGALTFTVEHAEDGFCDGDEFFSGNPIVQHVSRSRLGAESAPHQQLESRLFLGIEGGDDTKVMHDAQACVGLRAGKGHLEFSPHFLAHGIPQEEFPQGICPRKDIERFVWVQTREGRGGDVAHGVATRFAQGHLALLKLRPELGTVLEFDMVDLNVLPGGQMVFAGGVFVADIQDGSELVKRQQSHGNLDSNHLNARLPLAVNPASQPKASEPFFIHATLFVQEDARLSRGCPSGQWGRHFVDETEHEVGDCRVKKKTSTVGGLCRV